MSRIWPILVVLLSWLLSSRAGAEPKKLLYVVSPGIRNYLELGGAGISVFDIDQNYKFVKRIPTPASLAAKPEAIKGVCASVINKKLYFSTLTRLYCLDLMTQKSDWDVALPGGCDRMSITPDGKIIYIPSLEKEHWNIVDAHTGKLIKSLTVKNRAHNTVGALDGSHMYLGCIGSNFLHVASTKSHDLVHEIGPFSGGIRPFTVDGKQQRAYVCVNGLLGFEVGDIKSGKVLHSIKIDGFKQGEVKRHGCPSHGVGLTPDEKQVWVCDAANSHMHVFDNTVSPPRQVASVKVRDQPGWISFSRDGKHAWPSTLDMIDTSTKKIVASLMDEEGREVHSEKIIEIWFEDGIPIWVGDQFGLGRNR